MVAPDDLDIALRAAQSGDQDAFRRIYRVQQPALLRYLRVLVGQDADDIASETWLQITRDLTAFAGDWNNFRGWTATIARHRAMDSLRAARRRPQTTTPIDHLPHPTALEHTADQALGPPPRSSASAAPAGLAALCRDLHDRGDKQHRGKALDEQHFAELVRQAGKKDPDRVDRFCARLEPAEARSSGPNVTTSPSSPPNGSTRPSNPPGNPPSTRPGEHPGYPSGKPSTPPTRPTPTRPLR